MRIFIISLLIPMCWSYYFEFYFSSYNNYNGRESDGSKCDPDHLTCDPIFHITLTVDGRNGHRIVNEKFKSKLYWDSNYITNIYSFKGHLTSYPQTVMIKIEAVDYDRWDDNDKIFNYQKFLHPTKGFKQTSDQARSSQIEYSINILCNYPYQYGEYCEKICDPVVGLYGCNIFGDKYCTKDCGFGYCSGSVHDFHCVCHPGWTGSDCSIKITSTMKPSTSTKPPETTVVTTTKPTTKETTVTTTTPTTTEKTTVTTTTPTTTEKTTVTTTTPTTTEKTTVTTTTPTTTEKTTVTTTTPTTTESTTVTATTPTTTESTTVTPTTPITTERTTSTSTKSSVKEDTTASFSTAFIKKETTAANTTPYSKKKTTAATTIPYIKKNTKLIKMISIIKGDSDVTKPSFNEAILNSVALQLCQNLMAYNMHNDKKESHNLMILGWVLFLILLFAEFVVYIYRRTKRRPIHHPIYWTNMENLKPSPIENNVCSFNEYDNENS